jgi:DNA-binding transcriptional ArsR family regulator
LVLGYSITANGLLARFGQGPRAIMPRTKARLPLALLDELAERFKALAEPNRLAILSALYAGERRVGALVQETRLGQANVSRHLDVLRRYGFVKRRKQGLNVFYRVADDDVFRLCDIMCGRATHRRPTLRIGKAQRR